MKTTLNKIRKHSPCASGWAKLLKHLGKTQADDDPLGIATIVESNGFDDALWCLRAVDGRDKEMRLYAVWCARQVQHLMTDKSSIDALDTVERYANGQATDVELGAALGAAREVAREVARAAAQDAAWDAARAAAQDAAWDAAQDAAREAAWDAAQDAAREATWEATWDAARQATWEATWDAARTAQTQELLRVCAEVEAGVDPYPTQGETN